MPTHTTRTLLILLWVKVAARLVKTHLCVGISSHTSLFLLIWQQLLSFRREDCHECHAHREGTTWWRQNCLGQRTVQLFWRIKGVFGKVDGRNNYLWAGNHVRHSSRRQAVIQAIQDTRCSHKIARRLGLRDNDGIHCQVSWEEVVIFPKMLQAGRKKCNVNFWISCFAGRSVKHEILL